MSLSRAVLVARWAGVGNYCLGRRRLVFSGGLACLWERNHRNSHHHCSNDKPDSSPDRQSGSSCFPVPQSRSCFLPIRSAHSPTPPRQPGPQGETPFERDLAAGAKVPLRPAAFRSTTLRTSARRNLRGRQRLAGPLHGPAHLLVSLLSVEFPYQLHPLLPHREPRVPIDRKVVIHGAPVRPRRLPRPFLRPFHTAAVGFSFLALDPPYRFRMRFSQRDGVPTVTEQNRTLSVVSRTP